MPLKFILGNNGKKQLYHNFYTYYKTNKRNYWICTDKRCTATITTSGDTENDQIVRLPSVLHYHTGVIPTEALVKQTLAIIRNRIEKDTEKYPNEIFTEEFDKLKKEHNLTDEEVNEFRKPYKFYKSSFQKRRAKKRCREENDAEVYQSAKSMKLEPNDDSKHNFEIPNKSLQATTTFKPETTEIFNNKIYNDIVPINNQKCINVAEILEKDCSNNFHFANRFRLNLLLIKDQEIVNDENILAVLDFIKSNKSNIGGLIPPYLLVDLDGKNFDLNLKEKNIFILNVNNHWVTLTNLNEFNEWLLLDGLNKNKSICLKNLKPFFRCMAKYQKKAGRFKILTVEVPKQIETIDSGLIASAYAICLANDLNPALLTFDQSKLRQHYNTCVSNGLIFTNFPHAITKTEDDLIYQLHNLNLSVKL